MADQVQLRRGTTAQHATFTGAEGEITYDTDKKTIVVHDNVTAGGIALELNSAPKGLGNVWYYMTAGSPYTWVKPDGLHSVRVFVHGSGGAGASGSSDITGGSGGGGAGGAAIKIISADLLGSTVSITVGKGATTAVSVAANVAQLTGNTSSFGTFVSATGGSAGTSSSGGTGPGGAGGSGVGGDINITGGTGGRNILYETDSAGEGCGGSGGNGCILGGQGGVSAPRRGSMTFGLNGQLGSGGAGGYGYTNGGYAGGNGGDGFVIVEEIYL